MNEPTVDNVNHPTHYKPSFRMRQLECIDITRCLSFDLGNAFKYVWRAGRKGAVLAMILLGKIDAAKEGIEELRKELRQEDDWM